MPRLGFRVPLDRFVLALLCVLLAATLLPCRGDAARVVHLAGDVAIVAMFFLQGARLSPDAVLRGATHWRLHVAIGATTFVLFPVLGCILLAIMPGALSPPLAMGVLFLCALPSTVQSSVALTSIARGNVPGAVCAATLSTIAGIAITPVLFGALSHLHGGGIDLNAISLVALQLLLPFIVGHAARPLIGGWAERNRTLLSFTDRGSILLVVYGAFSAAVARGIWRQVPLTQLGMLTLPVVALLLLVLLATALTGRALRLAREDEAALLMCGVQKSVVSGVPIANNLFAAGSVGMVLLPLLIYYPIEMILCAWLARRHANRAALMPEAAVSLTALIAAAPAQTAALAVERAVRHARTEQ